MKTLENQLVFKEKPIMKLIVMVSTFASKRIRQLGVAHLRFVHVTYFIQVRVNENITIHELFSFIFS